MSSINKIRVIGGSTYGFDGDYNNSFEVQQLKLIGEKDGTFILDQDNGLLFKTGENEIYIGLFDTEGNQSPDGEVRASGLFQTWTGLRIGAGTKTNSSYVDIGPRGSFNIGCGNTIDLSKAKKTLAIGSYLTSESQDGQILIGYRNDPTEAGFAGYAIVVSGAAKDTTGNVFRVSRTTGTTIIGRERKITLDGDGTIKATSLTLGNTTLTETQLQSLLALLTKSTEA